MFKKKKKNLIHKDEPYLIAHILRKEGSVSSLRHFIDTHPAGQDAARRDIIKMKYMYSKCSYVVQNIIRKMVTQFEKFCIQRIEFWYDNAPEKFTVTDNDTGLWFKLSDKKVKIAIPNDGILTTDQTEWTLFLYATKSVDYIKENIKEMQKSQLTEKMKQRYIDTYST